MLTLATVVIMLIIVCLLAGLTAGTQDYKEFFSDGNMIHFWNRKDK